MTNKLTGKEELQTIAILAAALAANGKFYNSEDTANAAFELFVCIEQWQEERESET